MRSCGCARWAAAVALRIGLTSSARSHAVSDALPFTWSVTSAERPSFESRSLPAFEYGERTCTAEPVDHVADAGGELGVACRARARLHEHALDLVLLVRVGEHAVRAPGLAGS